MHIQEATFNALNFQLCSNQSQAFLTFNTSMLASVVGHYTGSMIFEAKNLSFLLKMLESVKKVCITLSEGAGGMAGIATAIPIFGD